MLRIQTVWVKWKEASYRSLCTVWNFIRLKTCLIIHSAWVTISRYLRGLFSVSVKKKSCDWETRSNYQSRFLAGLWTLFLVDEGLNICKKCSLTKKTGKKNVTRCARICQCHHAIKNDICMSDWYPTSSFSFTLSKSFIRNRLKMTKKKDYLWIL